MAGVCVATRIVLLSRIPVRKFNGACARSMPAEGGAAAAVSGYRAAAAASGHPAGCRPACPERSPGDDLGCDVWPQGGPAVFRIAAPVVPVVGRVHADEPSTAVLVAGRDVGRSAWLAPGLAVDEFMRDTAGGQLGAERVEELSHCRHVVSFTWRGSP